MNPELAVAIGRDHKARHRCVLDTGVVGTDKDRVAAAHHPQHFKGQRRHDRALSLHHNGNTPDDTVAFGADGEQAAPAGCLFENGYVPQQSREIQKIWPRVTANGCEPDRRLHSRGLRHREGKA